MKKWILLIGFVFTSLAYGQIDLSPYELTQEQEELIRRLEARGLDPELLHRYAQAIVRERNRPPVYVPAHTLADLNAVILWAQGGGLLRISK